MTKADEPKEFPVQGGDRNGRGQGTVRESVYMAAYKVYSHVMRHSKP